MYKIIGSIFIITIIICCSSKNQTHNVNRNAKISNFSKALQIEYKNSAQMALHDYIFLDYLYFNRKAERAAAGEEVAPDTAAKAGIPDLVWARGRLESFMVDSVKEKYPYLLAHSQMLYDCWLARASKNRKPAKTEECRMDFVIEMAVLENILMPVHDNPW
jgi:hypothetical protein